MWYIELYNIPIICIYMSQILLNAFSHDWHSIGRIFDIKLTNHIVGLDFNNYLKFDAILLETIPFGYPTP